MARKNCRPGQMLSMQHHVHTGIRKRKWQGGLEAMTHPVLQLPPCCQLLLSPPAGHPQRTALQQTPGHSTHLNSILQPRLKASVKHTWFVGVQEVPADVGLLTMQAQHAATTCGEVLKKAPPARVCHSTSSVGQVPRLYIFCSKGHSQQRCARRTATSRCRSYSH